MGVQCFSAAVIFVIAICSVAFAATDEDDITTPSGRGDFNFGLVENGQRTGANGKSPRVAGQLCGQSKYPDAGNVDLIPRPRIVGGQQARQYEFPWQASLRYNGQHICGASIIGSTWILTAASCIVDYNSVQMGTNVTVAVGEYQLNDGASTVRQVLRVARYTTYSYNRVTQVNDIALLELNGSISFNENVAPICLPYNTTSFDFQKSVASGWGVTYGGSSTGSNILRYTTLNITTNVICNSIFYATYLSNPIGDGMLCTRDNIDDRTRDACQGDGGGPLVVKGIDGKFTLAGIVSWGRNCSVGFPGVNTRVTTYVNIITSETGIEPAATPDGSTPREPTVTPAGADVFSTTPAFCSVQQCTCEWITRPCSAAGKLVYRGTGFTAIIALLVAAVYSV